MSRLQTPILPPPLRLRPSRSVLLGLFGLHLGVIIVAYLGSSRGLYSHVAAGLVILSGLFYLRRYGLQQGRCQFVRLVPLDLLNWTLVDSSSGESPASLSGVLNSRHLVILRFSLPERRFSCYVLVPWDAVDSENHRKLRVALRLQATAINRREEPVRE